MNTKKVWFCSGISRYNGRDVFSFVKAENLDDAARQVGKPYNTFQMYEIGSIQHLFKNVKKTRNRIDFDFLSSSYSVCLHDVLPFIVKRSIREGKNYFSYSIDFSIVSEEIIDYIMNK